MEVILVGNKIDLPGRVISRAEGQQFATQENLLFEETTAMDGNVNQVFEKLCASNSLITKASPTERWLDRDLVFQCPRNDLATATADSDCDFDIAESTILHNQRILLMNSFFFKLSPTFSHSWRSFMYLPYIFIRKTYMRFLDSESLALRFE